MTTPLRILAAAALLLGTAAADGAVRLTYNMAGAPRPVAWSAASFPLTYKVDRRLAAMFGNSSAIVDRAFNAWAAVGDATVAFRTEGVADGVKAGFDRQNTVSLADELYRDQHFIAVTTNWYDDTGQMIEADIQIDPVVVSGAYNAQLTIQHEIGHMLGLDHSPVLSSVMYPYVGRSGPTALDSDDKLAIAGVYPKSDLALTGATLTGRVIGDSGGIFAAQVVAVNERGEPVSTSLTDSTGEFILQPIPDGTYRLYAEPLDGPVDPKNFAGIWRDAKQISFPTQFMSDALRVESGKVYGNLIVNAAGAATLNPKWIGANRENRADFSLGATPVTLRAGETISLAIGGDGFTSGMTTFDVLNPGLQRTSDFRYAGNYVYATFVVAADARGSAVVVVRSGNATATLTGALRVDSMGGRSRSVR